MLPEAANARRHKQRNGHKQISTAWDPAGPYSHLCGKLCRMNSKNRGT